MPRKCGSHRTVGHAATKIRRARSQLRDPTLTLRLCLVQLSIENPQNGFSGIPRSRKCLRGGSLVACVHYRARESALPSCDPCQPRVGFANDGPCVVGHCHYHIFGEHRGACIIPQRVNYRRTWRSLCKSCLSRTALPSLIVWSAKRSSTGILMETCTNLHRALRLPTASYKIERKRKETNCWGKK